MLFDVTYGDPRLVDPGEIEENEHFEALERKLHKKTFTKILNTIETSVEDLVTAGSNKLIWTKTGALLGHSADAPHKDVNHLWDSVSSVMGDGKVLLKTVGVLVLHTIAKRPENHWLVYRTDSDSIDPDTGKTIKIANYWIDQNFTPPVKKTKIEQLTEKWGART